jgi:hypothetical protein
VRVSDALWTNHSAKVFEKTNQARSKGDRRQNIWGVSKGSLHMHQCVMRVLHAIQSRACELLEALPNRILSKIPIEKQFGMNFEHAATRTVALAEDRTIYLRLVRAGSSPHNGHQEAAEPQNHR